MALVFPAAPTIGQIYSPGDGSPSYVYRGDSVWQNVGMGYGYGPVAFTATPGQTTINVAYQVGAVDVYVEGARLLPEEFTATNGTSIVMAVPFLGGEKGVVIPHSVLSTLQGLRKDLNLGDLPSVSTAQANLGLTDRLLPVGMTAIFPFATPPSGWLAEDGAAIAIASYAALDALMYCGNAANPTAAWGYRCTNPANPTGSRSTSGTHIVLRDRRGEFERGWDNARGVDSGRSLWAYQNSTRVPTLYIDSTSFFVGAKNSPLQEGDAVHGGTITRSIIGGSDNSTVAQQYFSIRPRNVAGLACIKY